MDQDKIASWTDSHDHIIETLASMDEQKLGVMARFADSLLDAESEVFEFDLNRYGGDALADLVEPLTKLDKSRLDLARGFIEMLLMEDTSINGITITGTSFDYRIISYIFVNEDAIGSLDPKGEIEIIAFEALAQLLIMHNADKEDTSYPISIAQVIGILLTYFYDRIEEEHREEVKRLLFECYEELDPITFKLGSTETLKELFTAIDEYEVEE